MPFNIVLLSNVYLYTHSSFINFHMSIILYDPQVKQKGLLSFFEAPHDKTNKMSYAPSEDSDLPGHLPGLISLRCPHEETLGP